MLDLALTDWYGELLRRVWDYAHTDDLTGINNRRAFDEDLRSALIGGGEFALLLFDIDHFKRYNDTCGHVAGDELLRKLGGCLRHGGTRPQDSVYRYGGEEFAVICHVLTLEKGVEIANRLRHVVKNLDCSISIGVSHSSQASSTKELIVLADGALYEAKHGGRDRVCVAFGNIG